MTHAPEHNHELTGSAHSRPLPEVREWDLTDVTDDGEVVEVTVTGRLLGRASSEKSAHNHDSDYVERGVRCSACRWFDVLIIATDEDPEADDDYLVYTCGRTVVPGELDRPRFVWTSSPYEIVSALTVRQDGQPKLPVASDRALAQAAARDDAVADAYVNRAVA